jgi:hypothetical protein
MKDRYTFCVILFAVTACCGDGSVLLDTSMTSRADPVEASISWLDCSVQTQRFKQYCKISDRTQALALSLPGPALDAAIEGLIRGGKDAQPALIPHLRLTGEWESNPRCWSAKAPSGALQVVSGGHVLGALHVGINTFDQPLLGAANEPLWTFERHDSHVVLQSHFKIVDPAPSPFADGRSPQPLPLICDVRISQMRVEYDGQAVTQALAQTQRRLSEKVRLLRKERILHATLAHGQTAGGCHLWDIAQSLLSAERRHRASPWLTWDGLSAGTRQQIVDMVIDAVDASVLPAAAAHDSWQYFITHLSQQPRGCRGKLEEQEPNAEIFEDGRGTVRNHLGWHNAVDYGHDLEAYEEIQKQIRALSHIASTALCLQAQEVEVGP